MHRKILVITGPTAAGKSSLVTNIDNLYEDFKVINGDSKQIYREIPILTAQPVLDNNFFLYGHISAVDDTYSVSKWINDVRILTMDSWNNNKVPLIVGGTPLYLYCLVNGISCLPNLKPHIIDEIKEEFISLGEEKFISYIRSNYSSDYGKKYGDHYRLIRDAAYLKQTGKTIEKLYDESEVIKLKYDSIEILAFVPEREQIYNNINERLLQMIDEGVIEEVRELMKYPSIYKKSEVMTIHGMREIIDYLNSRISFNEMIEKTQKNIRNYAKRQLTWFRNKFHDIKIFNCREQILNYIGQSY